MLREKTAMSDTQDTDLLAARCRRATYRANYRGTKEMDWLLGKFADACVPGMDEPVLALFERLLLLPDPDVNDWILDPARVAQPEFAGLIADIRAFHQLTGTLDKPMTGLDR
jgi:antitoxin CptB